MGRKHTDTTVVGVEPQFPIFGKDEDTVPWCKFLVFSGLRGELVSLFKLPMELVDWAVRMCVHVGLFAKHAKSSRVRAVRGARRQDPHPK